MIDGVKCTSCPPDTPAPLRSHQQLPLVPNVSGNNEWLTVLHNSLLESCQSGIPVRKCKRNLTEEITPNSDLRWLPSPSSSVDPDIPLKTDVCCANVVPSLPAQHRHIHPFGFSTFNSWLKAYYLAPGRTLGMPMMKSHLPLAVLSPKLPTHPKAAWLNPRPINT